MIWLSMQKASSLLLVRQLVSLVVGGVPISDFKLVIWIPNFYCYLGYMKPKNSFHFEIGFKPPPRTVSFKMVKLLKR